MNLLEQIPGEVVRQPAECSRFRFGLDSAPQFHRGQIRPPDTWSGRKITNLGSSLGEIFRIGAPIEQDRDLLLWSRRQCLGVSRDLLPQSLLCRHGGSRTEERLSTHEREASAYYTGTAPLGLPPTSTTQSFFKLPGTSGEPARPTASDSRAYFGLAETQFFPTRDLWFLHYDKLWKRQIETPMLWTLLYGNYHRCGWRTAHGFSIREETIPCHGLPLLHLIHHHAIKQAEGFKSNGAPVERA